MTMGKDRAPEDTGAVDDGLFGDWDDAEYDPNNRPDWSLEDDEPKDDDSGNGGEDFEAFVEALSDKLDEDIGFAGEPDSIQTLTRMYLSDRANYARAEQILRGHKLLSLVRSTVRQNARKQSSVQAVPGGGEALEMVRVRDQLGNAPVHADAVVPASWLIDGDPSGPRRYRLVKKLIRRGPDGYYTEHVGVAYNPILITATMIDVADAGANLRISWLSRGRWRHRVVPRQKLCQPRDLIEALSGTHGFPANVNNSKDIVAFLADYEAFNEEVIPTRPMSSQMGWQGKAMELGFVAGRQHLKGDDDTPDVHFVGADEGEEQLARCVRAEGSLDEWISTAKITSHFPAVEVGIYAALAPPLLEVLKAPNFTVDWSHKTSAGKTTTLSVAASCWGNPDPNASDSLIASWDMTSVGFERRAAALSCMPMIVDDSKRARAYRGDSIVPGVVYAITNGQGRARGSVKGMQKTQYWRTVMLSTGEQRLIDFDKSGGTPARVVTLWGNPFGANSQTIAEAIRKLKYGFGRNFGHAGPAVVQWLLDNTDRWDEIRDEHNLRWSQLRDAMVAMTSSRSMDMSVMDRIACNLAVIDVTAQVAHQAMDLPWKTEGLVEKLLPMVAPAAGAVDRELEALRMVVSWASANRGKFIVSEKHRKEDEPHSGWLGYWEAAADDDWDVLAFFPGSLRDCLKANGFEPNAILRQWAEAEWLMAPETRRLTSRITELTGRPRMVVLKRDAVEGAGDLSTGAAAVDPSQPDMPF